MRSNLPIAICVVAACAVGVALAIRAPRGAKEPGPREPAPTGANQALSVGRIPAEVPGRPDASFAVGASPASSDAELDAPAPDPDASRWAKLNNDATIFLTDGRLEEAIDAFTRCAEAHPSNEVFRGNLGEALVRLARAQYEARELDLAIPTFERALPYVDGRADIGALRAILTRWRDEREVEANHWTEGSELFELSYDTDRSDILHHSQTVLDHLEREYDDLRGWFGVDPVREADEPASARIRVVLYKQADFGRLTGLGDWAGGAFDGVVRVAVEDLLRDEMRWRRILTHELAHAFMNSIGGESVPGWLNEGLAQFLELRGAADRVVAAAAARRRLGSTLFALERLGGTLSAWEDSDEIGRAYAQSLLLVDRVAADYGDEALRRMVAGCAQRRDPAATFEEWTRVPLSFVLERLLAE